MFLNNYSNQIIIVCLLRVIWDRVILSKAVIWVGLVWFYGVSTIVGYLMPNPLYTYIFNIGLGLVGFYCISTIVDYLMPNPLYIFKIYMIGIYIL